MRLLIRKIVSSLAFYVFLILIAFNFPKAIYQSAEFERRAIISSFGIDRVEDEYEIYKDGRSWK